MLFKNIEFITRNTTIYHATEFYYIF